MKKWFASFSILLVALLAGCAPQAAPAPATSAPPSPVATVLQSATPIPTTSPEDAAWAKIVAAAKHEGKVNAYSYTWIGDTGLAIAQGFKARYSISLDIITGTGAQFTERIKNEKRAGQLVADMTEGSSLLINNMGLSGLLTAVADKLPALKDKGVWAVDPTAIDPQNKANLAWRLVQYSPYINTNLVKPEDVPHSWKDLLDPKWKGKMTMTEPNLSSGPYEYMVVLLDNKVWDEGYIKGLYQQKLFFPTGIPDELLALAQGQYALEIRGADVDAARFASQGAPIQAIDMKEGLVLTTASVAAIDGGPNPNATKVFLNWIYGPEGMGIAAKVQGNKMVRTDVPDFRPKAVQLSITKPFVETPAELQKATELFKQKWFDSVVGRHGP